MELKEGQKVIVRRNLGFESGHGRGNYFSGISLKDVPLGSRGVVHIVEEETYKIQIGQKYYRFIANELKAARSEGEEASKLDSILEEKLSEEAHITAEEVLVTVPAKQIAPKARWVDLFPRLINYFMREREPSQRSFGNPFEPKFNVREEFAVWIEREFPGFYNGAEEAKKKVLQRKKEVYTAAILACEHGEKTSQQCVRSSFESLKDSLTRADEDFSFYCSIRDIATLTDKVSINLGLTNQSRHYGTKLDITR